MLIEALKHREAKEALMGTVDALKTRVDTVIYNVWTWFDCDRDQGKNLYSCSFF